MHHIPGYLGDEFQEISWKVQFPQGGGAKETYSPPPTFPSTCSQLGNLNLETHSELARREGAGLPAL